VGGGVLYVPLVSGFFPFHLDFVRCVGLLVALSGAVAAGPGLLRKNLANLRLALPTALIASVCAMAGAYVGLALPVALIQAALGMAIIGIAALLFFAKNVERPNVTDPDRIGIALGLCGSYTEESRNEKVIWRAHRTVPGLLLFMGVGFLAGMFGMGAGWANVPVFNLVMGVPLKVSIATSNFMLSMTGPSAAWVYLNRGCVIPLIAVPSIVGLMLGARVGVKVLARTKPKVVRKIVIAVLLFAGAKALLKGLGVC